MGRAWWALDSLLSSVGVCVFACACVCVCADSCKHTCETSRQVASVRRDNNSVNVRRGCGCSAAGCHVFSLTFESLLLGSFVVFLLRLPGSHYHRTRSALLAQSDREEEVYTQTLDDVRERAAAAERGVQRRGEARRRRLPAAHFKIKLLFSKNKTLWRPEKSRK